MGGLSLPHLIILALVVLIFVLGVLVRWIVIAPYDFARRRKASATGS